MRRPALLTSLLPVALLLLSGCEGSGFWRYEHDTLTLPGANPNMPAGSSENYSRSRHGRVDEPAPLLTEAGDIWPGPGQTVPTLKDLQRQQSSESAGNTGGSALAPLPALPSLPGYEISAQDPRLSLPAQVYPDSQIATTGGRIPIHGDQAYKPGGGPAASGNIVVPNGNGTSTVISPTGQVTTIPTPK